MQNSNLELIFDPDEIDNRNNNGEIVNVPKSMEKSSKMMKENMNNINEHAT